MLCISMLQAHQYDVMSHKAPSRCVIASLKNANNIAPVVLLCCVFSFYCMNQIIKKHKVINYTAIKCA